MIRVTSFCAAILCSSIVAAAPKSLDFDDLRGRSYDEIKSTANHDEGFVFGVTGSVAINRLPIANLLSLRNKVEKGRAIQESFEIEDPAAAISEALARFLGESIEVVVSLGDLPPLDKKERNFAGVMPMRSEEHLASEFGDGKLVVNVASGIWMAEDRRKDRYWLLYGSSVEILDTSSKEILWRDNCITRPRKNAELPSSTTILDDNAQSLKDEIEIAKNYCLERFIANMTGID